MPMIDLTDEQLRTLTRFMSLSLLGRIDELTPEDNKTTHDIFDIMVKIRTG